MKLERIRKRKMLNIDSYINLLVDILNCAEKEKSAILNGEITQWSLEEIESIIIPEISELLLYAKNGKVYFKYGKKQRLLASTYLMTDSKDLFHTILGAKISNLQELYNTL